MPLNAKQVKRGTRDHCHFCNEVIELTSSDDDPLYRRLYWVHLDKGVRECEDKKKGEPRRLATSRTYCGETMNNSWYTQTCFRPIKDHERLMCGIHSAAARKRDQRDQEYEQKWELNDYISNELQKIGLRIKEEFGLTVRAEYDYQNHHYTGNIIVDPNELMAFLSDITSKEDEDDDTEWEVVGDQ